MCTHCENPSVPVSAAEFLTGRPRDTVYRSARACLWRAFIAAQPPGTPPADTKQELYAQANALPGVTEVRTAQGRFFRGIAAV